MEYTQTKLIKNILHNFSSTVAISFVETPQGSIPYKVKLYRADKLLEHLSKI